jgi:hypothetical protein
MTRAYFDGGGMEVQYNVGDGGRCASAGEPEKYHNLVVRIAASPPTRGHDDRNAGRYHLPRGAQRLTPRKPKKRPRTVSVRGFSYLSESASSRSLSFLK